MPNHRRWAVRGLVVCFALSHGFSEEIERLPELVVDAEEDDRVIPEHFAGEAVVISEKEIAEAGARSVAEVLAARGGVRFTSTSGNPAGGSAHLRGFGENSASRVLVLVDGRPINRADMASISWLEVPVSRLERVEILRGPQTARFGDNAVGGVIHLITKDGAGRSTGTEVAAGSDGYRLARASHRERIDGHGLSFDFERNESDGWRQNSWSDITTAGLRWDKRWGRVDAEWGISWAEEGFGFPGPLGEERYRRDPRQSIYVEFGQADQYFSEAERWASDGRVGVDLGGGLGFQMPLSFLRRDLEWNFGPGFHVDNRLDGWTIAPALEWRGRSATAAVGASFRWDALELDSFRELERIDQLGEASLDRSVAGVFATADWEIAPGWHLGSAARWERSELEARARSFVFPTFPALNFDRGTRETHRAAQLGLRWEPEEEWAAWVRYDLLYRLPSTDEIASYQGFPLDVPFNDELRAETGHNFEAGAEWNRDGWTAGLNVFLQRLEGEIAYDFNRNLNVNLADTRRFGGEAWVGYRADAWDFQLRYAGVDAEFQSGPYAGKDVYLVPNHEVTGLLGWRPHERVLVQGEWQWIGEAWEGNDLENERPKLPAYDVANLMVRGEILSGLSLYLRINNLFDERYATVRYNGAWYPAAGRQFVVGLRHDF